MKDIWPNTQKSIGIVKRNILPIFLVGLLFVGAAWGTTIRDTISEFAGLNATSLNATSLNVSGEIKANVSEMYNVKAFGAKGDGVTDDTVAFKNTISSAGYNHSVFIPKGNYVISDTLYLNTSTSVTGESQTGSQIYMNADKTLFYLNTNTNNILIEKVWLGSAATSTNTALIYMSNSHRNTVLNVIMNGSYYGVYLKGSLLNNLIDVKTPKNIVPKFFASVSTMQYGIYMTDYNSIQPNGNTIIAPILEDGVNGIYIKNALSGTIIGGVVEGISGEGLNLSSSSYVSVSNTFFEAIGSGKAIGSYYGSYNNYNNVYVAGGHFYLNTSSYNKIIGGKYYNLNVSADSESNTFIGPIASDMTDLSTDRNGLNKRGDCINVHTSAWGQGYIRLNSITFALESGSGVCANP